MTSVTHNWLVLTFQLPARPTAARMRVWRQLQRLGALPLKGGAYVLPNTPQLREDFEWLRADVVGLKGEASLFVADPADPRGAADLIAQFRDARAADFSALERDALAEARRARGHETPRSRRALRQLNDRLQHLESIDFFGAGARSAAADTIASLARRTGGPMPATVPEKPALKPAAYRSRVWVTRPRPGIDRFASAWLIRRFINPKARFVFAADADAAARQHPRAVPFDMFGAEFGHQDNECTFETLVRRFRLKAPGLEGLARLVHTVDLKDDRYTVPEAPAIHKIVEGLRRQHADDDALLERGIETIEALYSGR